MESVNTRLYITKNEKNWQNKVSHDYENICTCNYSKVKNGYILPVKTLPVAANLATSGIYSGGVQSEEGEFVAGHRRAFNDNFSLSCSSTYMLDSKQHNDAIFIDETIIYGGMLIDIFGHILTEAFSRLWYVLEHEDKKNRVAFCNRNGGDVPNYFYDFMELLGIDRERILIINEIVRFNTIIVPDQACINYIGFNSKICNVYEKMMKTSIKKLSKSDITQNSQRKIYLSRTQFIKDGYNDCINESYFEKFFERRGYEVISPESLSICEQVAIISSASEVICTGGTLSHLLLFAKENTKLLILLRCNEAEALVPQFVINQMKKLDTCIVDCSYNYLPTTHAGGVFLMGPTKDFINYLQKEGISYLPEEVNMDYEQTAWPYISSWAYNYSRNWYPYKRINKQDIFDVVNRMSEVILNKTLTRKQMATPIKSNISQKEFKELQDSYNMIKPLAGKYCIYEHGYQVLKEAVIELESKCLASEVASLELQEIEERPFVIFDVHFSKTGWINGNGEFKTVGVMESNRGIEAVRIELYPQNLGVVEYGVYIDKVGWKNGRNGQMAGSVGQSKTIIGLFVKLDEEIAEKYNILYRAGNGNCKTRWYRNGEITETFSWNKIETLEIYLECKEHKLNNNINSMLQKVDEYRNQLIDTKKCTKKLQLINEEQKSDIKELKEKLENGDEKISELERHIEILKNNESQYLQEIEELKSWNYQLEQSVCWKITKTLRRIQALWHTRRN